MRVVRTCIPTLLLALIPAAVSAQPSTARLAATVTDTTGGVLAGVTCQVTVTGAPRIAIADSPAQIAARAGIFTTIESRMVLLAAFAALALTWLSVTGVWSYAERWLTSRSKTKPLPFRRLPAVRAAGHAPAAVRLSEVPVGYSARLHDTRLDAESRSQLRALGLTDASLLRVCKQGEPCVVQVRTTRLGMSSRIAQQVLVIPFEDDKAREMSWQ